MAESDALVPVVVSDVDDGPSSGPSSAEHLTVIAPSGYQVVGLSLAEAVALLRAFE